MLRINKAKVLVEVLLVVLIKEEEVFISGLILKGGNKHTLYSCHGAGQLWF